MFDLLNTHFPYLFVSTPSGGRTCNPTVRSIRNKSSRNKAKSPGDSAKLEEPSLLCTAQPLHLGPTPSPRPYPPTAMLPPHRGAATPPPRRYPSTAMLPLHLGPTPPPRPYPSSAWPYPSTSPLPLHLAATPPLLSRLRNPH